MFQSKVDRWVMAVSTADGVLIEVHPEHNALSDVSAMCNQILKAIGHCRSDVTVSLEHMDIVPSALLATLLLGLCHLRRVGCSLRVTGLSENAKTLFQLHGMLAELQIQVRCVR